MCGSVRVIVCVWVCADVRFGMLVCLVGCCGCAMRCLCWFVWLFGGFKRAVLCVCVCWGGGGGVC